MASIIELINDKNFETFEELKKFFEAEPYFFDVITSGSKDKKDTEQIVSISESFTDIETGIIEPPVIVGIDLGDGVIYLGDEDTYSSKDIETGDVDAITEGIKNIDVITKDTSGTDVDTDENALGNLYMLSFTKKSDLSTKIARQANGIIFEKGSNKLIHYLFEKCYEGVCIEGEEYSQEDDKLPLDLFDEKNTYVELFFEGSVIKLFEYKDVWRLATSRCLDAGKASWSSKKSFADMFKECICNVYENTWENFIQHQTSNYCSSYIIQHPQNKMAINVAEPVAFLLNIIDLRNLKEIRLDSDNLRVDLTYSDIVTNKRKLTENFIVFQVDPETDIITHRIKILSDDFIERKRIYGNQQNIGLRYLEVLKDEQQTKLLRDTFPEYKSIFNRIDKIFYSTCKKIHRLYVRINVKKEDKEICPELYRRTLIQLHAQYRKTKQPITIQDVFFKLENLQPRVIANLIDYKF
jgi:hypothetical protein